MPIDVDLSVFRLIQDRSSFDRYSLLENGTDLIYPNPTDDATVNAATGWTSATALNAGEFRDEHNGTTIFAKDATVEPVQYKLLVYSAAQTGSCLDKAQKYVSRSEFYLVDDLGNNLVDDLDNLLV